MGGTERCAQNYALAYASHGAASAVFAYEKGGYRESALAGGGVPVFVADIDAASAWAPDAVHVHRPGLSEPSTARIIERLNDEGARIVETNVFGKPDYSSTRLRISVHYHLSEWSRWKWQRRAASISPSPVGVVMPYALDDTTFVPPGDSSRALSRRHFRIPEDAVVFGRVGQPIEAKWDVDIVKAFSAHCDRHRNSLLALVGAPASVRAEVERLPAAVRSRVHVLEGAITDDEELRRFYWALDCFLHSSRIGESFGMVIAESLLCGVPVITRVRPYRDNTQALLVEHRRNGLLVAGVRGMVRALNEVALDGEASLRRGAIEGREDFASAYSVETLGPRVFSYTEAATRLDPEAFRVWLQNTEAPTIRGLWENVSPAYGRLWARPASVKLAHSSTLYRAIARVKYGQ